MKVQYTNSGMIWNIYAKNDDIKQQLTNKQSLTANHLVIQTKL